MLMDIELYTKVNETIAELQKEFHEMTNRALDMVVMQDDKYRNTEYETIVYGLGCSAGMKSKNYYFNAVNEDDNALAERYYNEPVSFYEHNGEHCMQYRIMVDTMSRNITVFKINYVYAIQPDYIKVQEFHLGNSKFKKKVLQMELA